MLVALVAAPTALAAPATFSYAGPPVAIPDATDLSGNSPGAPAEATVTAAGLAPHVTDIDFRIDGTACSTTAGSTTVGIAHTFVNDLELRLTSPGGTTVKVIDNTDGSGNNFCQVLLDDDAASSIQSAVTANAPFTGTWMPANPLSAFDGQNPNGSWTLAAQDFFSGDTGSIRAFSVIIDTKGAPTIGTTASPDITLGGQITDAATISGRFNPQPGASVDFRLYGPDDSTCAGPPVFESPAVPVPVTDEPVTSAAFTPSAPGVYRWRAFYSGDANNEAVAGACDAPGESVSVAPKPDADGDGVPDASDNCGSAANPSQADADGDRIGDACDPINDLACAQAKAKLKKAKKRLKRAKQSGDAAKIKKAKKAVKKAKAAVEKAC